MVGNRRPSPHPASAPGAARAPLSPAPRRPAAGVAAVSAIKNYIVENRLRPGDPLPTETHLQEILGVSRSSVREALRTLQSLDIVEIAHGRGMTVGALSFAPMVEAVVFRARLNAEDDLATLREVVAVRESLDLTLGPELIEHYRGSDLPELRQLVEDMRAQVAFGETFQDSDCAFHTQLLSATSNTLLQQLSMAFWDVHMASIPYLDLPEASDISDTVEAHGQIVDALVAGDLEAYAEAVHTHYRPLKRLLDAAAAAGDEAEKERKH